MTAAVARKRRVGKTQLLLRLLAVRLRRVGVVFAAALAIVTAAIYLLERDAPGTHVHGVGDAAWFCVVTLSTVGYGDVYPVTAAGRAVTGVFILFTLSAIGLLLSAISEAILEVKRMEDHGLIGTTMRGHVIAYGFGPVARVAIEELLAAGRRVALVCDHAQELDEARALAPREQLFVTVGDFTQEVLRERLNAAEATTAVIAAEDDARNIIAALNTRAVNARARIIVAVRAAALRQTLIASGVTYVASPSEFSGRMVASAAFEPEVALFIEDVTSAVDAGHDLQQYAATPFAGQTVEAVRQRLIAADGPLLVGVATARAGGGGGYTVVPHPPRDHVIGRDDQIIVLGSREQAARMVAQFGLAQGR